MKGTPNVFPAGFVVYWYPPSSATLPNFSIHPTLCIFKNTHKKIPFMFQQRTWTPFPTSNPLQKGPAVRSADFPTSQEIRSASTKPSVKACRRETQPREPSWKYFVYPVSTTCLPAPPALPDLAREPLSIMTQHRQTEMNMSKSSHHPQTHAQMPSRDKESSAAVPTNYCCYQLVR